MATDNVTAISTTPAEPTAARSTTQPVYFYTEEGQPDIDEVIYGLHGVCAALSDDDQSGPHDYETRCRRGNLAMAAYVLSKQLHDRHTHKPWRARRPKTA